LAVGVMIEHFINHRYTNQSDNLYLLVLYLSYFLDSKGMLAISIKSVGDELNDHCFDDFSA